MTDAELSQAVESLGDFRDKYSGPLARSLGSTFVPRAGSLWLVVVECRYNVVAVCVSGKGFYIPGQEPCWGFSHVAEWIAEIDPANYQSTTENLPIGSLSNSDSATKKT